MKALKTVLVALVLIPVLALLVLSAVLTMAAVARTHPRPVRVIGTTQTGPAQPPSPEILAALAPVTAGTAGNPVTAVDLTGPWKFSTDRAENGQSLGWQKPDFDASSWRVLNAPGSWEEQGITAPNSNWPQEDSDGGYNGFAWYRKSVAVPADWTTGKVILRIGAIHDSDWTYLNGVQVGATTGEDAYQQSREYQLPPTALRPGQQNIIAIRVLDVAGAGGIYEGPVELVRGTGGAAPTDEAESPDTRTYTQSSKTITRIGGSVHVPADTRVDGDVVAVGGSITVDGRVDGDAVAVGGSVHLGPGARVDRDAISIGGRINRGADATIGGDTVEMAVFPGWLPGGEQRWPVPGTGAFFTYRPMELGVWVFLVLLSVFLFRSRLEVMARALPARPGAVAVFGVLGAIFTPAAIVALAVLGSLVMLLLIVTVVGILAVPAAALATAAAIFGILAIALVGTVAVALCLGRGLLASTGHRSAATIWAALLGVLVIWLLSLLPVVGWLVFFTVTIFGFGLALMTGVGTHEAWLVRRFGHNAEAVATPHLTTPAEPTSPSTGPASPTVPSADEEPTELGEPGEPAEPTPPGAGDIRGTEGEGAGGTRPEPPPS